MSKQTKNLLSIGMVALILVVLFGVKFALDLKPKLGLDLQGGIALVYQAKPSTGKTVDKAVLDKTVEKIRARIDKLGVAEPDITTQGADQVAVQLPGITDEARAKGLIGQTAQLQFRIVQEVKDAKDVKNDPAWAVTPVDQRKVDQPVILEFKEGKTDQIMKLGPTQLLGDQLKKATYQLDKTGAPSIGFELASGGAKTFGDITTANKGKQLAIVLDYVVESAPNIQEPITDGKGEITGKFTQKQANDLVTVLNIGALPVELTLLTEQKVSATLGRDSLNKGLLAGAIGMLVVALFMLLYYRGLGIVAVLALMVFGGLMFGFICVLGQFWTLTLAGIAGVIVSIGIAADSSIVYFERLKEELKAGRTLRSSADKAYSSAFRTIVAADTVSFGAAAILYLFAIGSVKGFAFTLGMATLFDVFVSYFFTRPLTSLLANLKWFEAPALTGVRIEDRRAGGEAK